MQSPPKAVIDTNVFISAVLFAGTASRLVTLWQGRRIIFLLSSEVLQEYIKVLTYPKFHLLESEIKHIIEQELLPFINPIMVTSSIKQIKEDPADNKFLALAIDGKADCIISGDKHLLALKQFHHIKIMTITHFLNFYL